MNIKHTPIALAVSGLLAAPLVMAQDLTESYAVSVSNSGSVSISSTSTSTTTQTTTVTADIPVTAKAQAVVDDKQLNSGHGVTNNANDNNARATGSAAYNAGGNIGVNEVAGDNNMQDNAASIAAADASFVFGAAESRTMTTQISRSNGSISNGSDNNAIVGTSGESNGAFAYAHGNVGVNVASGNSNLQKNNLAISTAHSRASIASVQNVQRSSGNVSKNTGAVVENGAGSTVATFTINYLPCNGGTNCVTSKLDVERFDTGNTKIGYETGTLELAGTASGTLTIPIVLNGVKSQSNANLTGNAFANASGNVGVNIAAGNNNLQNNSLSVAVSQAAP